MLYNGGVTVSVRVKTGFSVWLVSGYAHVFVLLSAVTELFALAYCKTFKTSEAAVLYQEINVRGKKLAKDAVQNFTQSKQDG